MTSPTVSVIIPTLGRASLLRAVDSVLSQTFPSFDIAISVDGPPETLDALSLPDDQRIRILYSDLRRGASATRAAGVAVTDSTFVAFLDDDDRWRPEKLERQVAAAEEMLLSGATHAVVACRVAEYSDQDVELDHVPRRLYEPGQPIVDYLFGHPGVRPNKRAMGTSMLLMSRSAFDSLHIYDNASLHEDWDWLLQLDALPGTRFAMVDDVLLEYLRHTASSPSASNRAAWRISLEWFDRRLPSLSPRQYANGLLTVTAPLALLQRDLKGCFQIAGRAARRGGGSPSAWGFLFASLALAGFHRMRERNSSTGKGA